MIRRPPRSTLFPYPTLSRSYQDSVILERLVRAARRGVKVHVMARPPHSLKKDQLVEGVGGLRSEEHTSELQSRLHLVCRLLLEKKKKQRMNLGKQRNYTRKQ